MCLIAIAYHVHKNYPLIVAANRDEFYDRPALALHKWPDSPIAAGRDVTKGGTWMGVAKGGRFAALTNVRSPGETAAERSRGEIVKGFLEAADTESFLRECNNRRNEFGGYNFIGGTAERLYYTTNQEKEEKQELSAGIHGISNAYLNTPWPKVTKVKSRLSGLLEQSGPAVSTESLFDLLSDTKEADDNQLPDTGVGYNLEKKLSPLFLNLEGYGTRSQTVLMISNKNELTIEEKTFQKNGGVQDHRTFNWKF